MTKSHPVQSKEISFIIHHVLAHDSCLFQPKRKSLLRVPRYLVTVVV